MAAVPVHPTSHFLSTMSAQFVLSVLGDRASARVKSAAEPFTRPVSQGSQSYDSNPAEYPVSEPMIKLTAPLQVWWSMGVVCRAYTVCT